MAENPSPPNQTSTEETLYKTSTEIQQMLSQSKAAIQQMEADKGNLSKFRANLESWKKALEQNVNKLTADIQTVDSLIATAKLKSNEYEQKTPQLDTKIEQAKEKVAALEAQATAANEAKQKALAAEEAASAAKAQIEEYKKSSEEAMLSIANNTQSVTNSTEAFSSNAQKTEELNKECDKKITSLNQSIETAKAQIQKIEDFESSATDLVTEINQKHTTAKSDVQKIAEVKQGFEQKKTEAETAHNTLSQQHETAKTEIEEVREAHTTVTTQSQKINSFYEELLEDSHDANGEIDGICIQSKITTAHEKINETLKKIQKDRQQALDDTKTLKITLEQEIRDLLPNAGAAGLAHSYNEAKAKYSAPKFDGKKIGIERLFEFLWHWARSNSTTMIYYFMFLTPLLWMLAYYIPLFSQYNGATIAPETGEEIIRTISPQLLIFRALLTIPAAFISLFGWNSIRISRRLYEEYNHKQRVMELYYSFKKEVEEHGSDEHKQALLSVMLKAVNDKPFMAMNKQDIDTKSLFTFAGISNVLPFSNNKNDTD